MIELVLNFGIGLAVVGLPAFAFYRLGHDVGVNRGVKKQMIKDLIARGIVEMHSRTPTSK